MLTLQRIINTTPAKIIKRAKSGCKRKFLGRYVMANNVVFVFSTGCETGSFKYVTQIGIANLSLGLNSPAVVHCTCPMFKFYLEVACARHGASFIYNALPLFPKITNPRGLCYLCKHQIYILEAVNTRIKRDQARIKARR